MLKGENYSGQFKSWSAPRKLAKIKPKNASSFVQGRISSSQDPNHSDVDFNKSLGSCSLGKDCSPTSLRNRRKEITHSFQVRDHCSEIIGVNNVDVASSIMEDIEVESDGEAPCFNVPSSSSSNDEEEEVGGETDCLIFETEMGQMDNQLDALEDIRVLVIIKSWQLTRHRMW